MKYPYLITSDQHCHAWSAFSRPEPDGVNSRLRIIHQEMARAHQALKDAGGTHHFYAGDLFHVRGDIKPSVFNPTFEVVKGLHRAHDQLEAYAIPGNHDLEGNDSDALGNAMQQLGTIDRFNVCTHPQLVGDVFVVPWIKDLNHLRQVIKEFADKQFKAGLASIDLVIHAPLNGVIKGLPDHGLDPAELAAFGFRRVFCGHYHNHVERIPGVYSIGATSHQTWSDPGTKAGFLLVYEDRVEWHESQAPKFVDLTPEYLVDLEAIGATIEDAVKGNYVRLKLQDVTEAEIKSWRNDIDRAGAAAVNIIASKTSTVGRTGASSKAAVSLEASVQHFIDNDMKPMHATEVARAAADVLMEARS